MPSRAHISRRAGTDPLIPGVVLPTQFVICRQEMKGYSCCVRRRRHPSILEIVHQHAPSDSRMPRSRRSGVGKAGPPCPAAAVSRSRAQVIQTIEHQKANQYKKVERHALLLQGRWTPVAKVRQFRHTQRTSRRRTR
jgi:hypothetical protein